MFHSWDISLELVSLQKAMRILLNPCLAKLLKQSVRSLEWFWLHLSCLKWSIHPSPNRLVIRQRCWIIQYEWSRYVSRKPALTTKGSITAPIQIHPPSFSKVSGFLHVFLGNANSRLNLRYLFNFSVIILSFDLIFPSEHVIDLGKIVSSFGDGFDTSLWCEIFLEVRPLPHHTHLPVRIS